LTDQKVGDSVHHRIGFWGLGQNSLGFSVRVSGWLVISSWLSTGSVACCEGVREGIGDAVNDLSSRSSGGVVLGGILTVLSVGFGLLDIDAVTVALNLRIWAVLEALLAILVTSLKRHLDFANLITGGVFLHISVLVCLALVTVERHLFAVLVAEAFLVAFFVGHNKLVAVDFTVTVHVKRWARVFLLRAILDAFSAVWADDPAVDLLAVLSVVVALLMTDLSLWLAIASLARHWAVLVGLTVLWTDFGRTHHGEAAFLGAVFAADSWLLMISTGLDAVVVVVSLAELCGPLLILGSVGTLIDLADVRFHPLA